LARGVRPESKKETPGGLNLVQRLIGRAAANLQSRALFEDALKESLRQAIAIRCELVGQWLELLPDQPDCHDDRIIVFIYEVKGHVVDRSGQLIG
jgi:hypothetical protein